MVKAKPVYLSCQKVAPSVLVKASTPAMSSHTTIIGPIQTVIQYTRHNRRSTCLSITHIATSEREAAYRTRSSLSNDYSP
jgi:hypothetical protein